MFFLIITIISIALVTALALPTIYCGGSTRASNAWWNQRRRWA